MSIASVLQVRNDLEASEYIKAAIYAKEIFVGKDYFVFITETKIGNHVLVKSSKSSKDSITCDADTEYSFELIKGIRNYLKTNTDTVFTSVDDKSPAMRKFLTRFGFVEKNEIYVREK